MKNVCGKPYRYLNFINKLLLNRPVPGRQNKGEVSNFSQSASCNFDCFDMSLS